MPNIGKHGKETTEYKTQNDKMGIISMEEIYKCFHTDTIIFMTERDRGFDITTIQRLALGSFTCHWGQDLMTWDHH